MHPIPSHTASETVLTLRSLAIYIAGTAALLACSVYALAALLGAMISELPRSSSEVTMSRVERWVQSEREVARTRSGESERTGVAEALFAPEAANHTIDVVETEGAGVVAASSSIPAGHVQPRRPVQKSQVTYRTVCVRLCDGAYFPLSFATTAKYLAADEALCQSRCGSPARMFYYRNPGQNVASMIDLEGRSYADLKSSFQFHASYNSSCACRAQPWDVEAKSRHERYAALDSSKSAVSDAGQRPRSVAAETALPPPPDPSRQKSLGTDATNALTASEPWLDVQARNGEPILVDMSNGKAEAALLSQAKSRNSVKAAQKVAASKGRARVAFRDRERAAHKLRYASVSPGEMVRMHLLGQY